jgi:hypothetical protein
MRASPDKARPNHDLGAVGLAGPGGQGFREEAGARPARLGEGRSAIYPQVRPPLLSKYEYVQARNGRLGNCHSVARA